MRIALDTNILVYAEGVNDRRRGDEAREIVKRLSRANPILPVQVLGELFHVLTRKARWSADAARAAVFAWRDAFSLIDTTEDALLSALDLAANHELRTWDAIIVAAAAEADCRLLLSEDLQDGFAWHGTTVVNPFAAQRHPLLEASFAAAAATKA